MTSHEAKFLHINFFMQCPLYAATGHDIANDNIGTNTVKSKQFRDLFPALLFHHNVVDENNFFELISRTKLGRKENYTEPEIYFLLLHTYRLDPLSNRHEVSRRVANMVEQVRGCKHGR